MTTETQPKADFEKHFVVAELAKQWHISARLLRKWFRDEPGVVAFGPGKVTRKNRTHKSLRIPKSVADRVYQKYVQQPDKDDKD